MHRIGLGPIRCNSAQVDSMRIKTCPHPQNETNSASIRSKPPPQIPELNQIPPQFDSSFHAPHPPHAPPPLPSLAALAVTSRCTASGTSKGAHQQAWAGGEQCEGGMGCRGRDSVVGGDRVGYGEGSGGESKSSRTKKNSALGCTCICTCMRVHVHVDWGGIRVTCVAGPWLAISSRCELRTVGAQTALAQAAKNVLGVDTVAQCAHLLAKSFLDPGARVPCARRGMRPLSQRSFLVVPVGALQA